MSSHFHFQPEYSIRDSIVHRHVLCPDGVYWAVTDDFTDSARNHCYATMLTNYLLFQQTESARSTYADPAQIRYLFRTVHSVSGNGPVFSVGRGSVRMLRDLGIRQDPAPIKKLRSRSGFRAAGAEHLSVSEIMYEKIRRRIDDGYPVALLVAAAPFDWHWVLAMGYAQAEYGRHFLLILDNWHRGGYQIYMPDDGCRLLSATALPGRK